VRVDGQESPGGRDMAEGSASRTRFFGLQWFAALGLASAAAWPWPLRSALDSSDFDTVRANVRENT
jgi:hypothetical protein